MHKILRCQSCMVILYQCRCIDPEKPVQWCICSLCIGKDMPAQTLMEAY